MLATFISCLLLQYDVSQLSVEVAEGSRHRYRTLFQEYFNADRLPIVYLMIPVRLKKEK